MKKLIIYFSRADENYFGGKLKYIDKGNTEIVAEKLSSLTGATLFKVEPKVPYAEDYKTCVLEAKKDRFENARPEVKSMPEDIEQYDIIFVLYPNYCGTIPMHLFTVLEKLDLSGKIILPLCTNEGSGMGASEVDIKKCCPDSKVKSGLSVLGSNAKSCDLLLADWVEKAF